MKVSLRLQAGKVECVFKLISLILVEMSLLKGKGSLLYNRVSELPVFYHFLEVTLLSFQEIVLYLVN